MEWTYYTLKEDGYLYDDNGEIAFGTKFKTLQEAEQYFIDNDLPGTIR